MAQIVKFHNRAQVPPRGGWRFTVQGNDFEKYTEDDLITAVRSWRQNNGTFTSDAAIEAEIWAAFCSREPARCGNGAQSASLSSVTPRELSPVWYGPIIWRYLNFEAVMFNKTAFITACNRIVSLMQCPACVEEWRDVMLSDPPTTLNNAFEACQWVWKQHSRVNAKLSKPEYPYSRMVADYGAPVAP